MTIVISKTIERMAVAGLHFGALRSRRNPTTKPFVHGNKGNIEIVDLEKTLTSLDKAKEFMAGLGKDGKQVLLVGNKGEAREEIKKAAESANLPFVALRWIGGTLTNFDEIRKRVNKLLDWREKERTGELAKYTKKERGNITFEMKKLERFFGGIIDMVAQPSAMIVIDSNKEEAAILEARALHIPVISLSNTDCNIDDIEYPIVGNDKAVPSISMILAELVSAYKEGRSGIK